MLHKKWDRKQANLCGKHCDLLLDYVFFYTICSFYGCLISLSDIKWAYLPLILRLVNSYQQWFKRFKYIFTQKNTQKQIIVSQQNNATNFSNIEKIHVYTIKTFCIKLGHHKGTKVINILSGNHIWYS